MKRSLSLCLLPLFFFMNLYSHPGPQPENEAAPVLILIRPLSSQIENLQELKKQGLLPAGLQVVAVHHQDELTDYRPAREYVAKNRLDWIRFQTIQDGIDMTAAKPGRGTNSWTRQFQALFSQSDGILFTGGMDLPPRLYGEEMALTTEATTPIRSVYELSFLHHLVGDGSDASPQIPFLEKRPDYAVLGICLGCQTLNAASGGTLIQDIPAQVYGLDSYEDVLRQPEDQIHSGRYIAGLNPHLEDWLPPALHPIRSNSLGRISPALFKTGNSSPLVLSSHHQALGRIGHGLVVTASSMDGRIVEMVEHERFPAVLGVQYHPEAMSLYRQDTRYRSVSPFGKPDLKTAAVPTDRCEWNNYGPISHECSYSLKERLEKTDSMPLHHALWHWFSSALTRSRQSR